MRILKALRNNRREITEILICIAIVVVIAANFPQRWFNYHIVYLRESEYRSGTSTFNIFRTKKIKTNEDIKQIKEFIIEETRKSGGIIDKIVITDFIRLNDIWKQKNEFIDKTE